MLNLLVPLAIGLLLTRPRPLLRTLLLMTIGLEAVGIILTFSRAGFLAMGITTVAWLWKFRRRRERGWVLAILVLGIACLPLLPSGYTQRLATMVNTNADPTGSAQARWQDTVAAIGYVRENPLIGAGIGQDILALNEVRGLGWRSVHNVYLQYAVDLGLPGAILFVVLLGFCLSSAASVERSGLGEGLPALAAGVRISLVAFVAAACFHPAGYHFYFFYIAGLAVSLRLIAELDPVPRRRGDRIGGGMMAAGATMPAAALGPAVGTAAQRVRLLKFVTLFAIGGTERQVVTLASGLDASRFHLHLACLRRTGELLDRMRSSGARRRSSTASPTSTTAGPSSSASGSPRISGATGSRSCTPTASIRTCSRSPPRAWPGRPSSSRRSGTWACT